MKKLSPSARRLFELARGQDEPDELARNRVARALSVKIAAGVSLTAAGASAATSAVALGSIVAKSTLVLAVTGALVASGWLTLRTLRPARPPAASPAPAAAVVKPAAAVHTEEPPSFALPPSDASKEPGKAPVYHRSARHSLPSEASTRLPEEGSVDRLRAETEALRLAQQALRDKLPEQALRLLDEQDLRFRDGLLYQERAGARILALCQAGRVEEARTQADRFARRWPRSALLGRVRTACWAP
jgi:hypothetical protein